MIKRVNIISRQPIVVKNTAITSAFSVELDTADIYKVLCQYANVEEVLDDGTVIPLTFQNYKEYNPRSGSFFDLPEETKKVDTEEEATTKEDIVTDEQPLDVKDKKEDPLKNKYNKKVTSYYEKK